MKPTLKTKKFIVCPECQQHDFCIQHLLDEMTGKTKRYNAGPWFCEKCGYGFTIAITRIPFGERIDITIEPHDKRQYKEWVVVDIPPRTEALRLVCEYIRSEPTITESHTRLTRFRYEENTSPVNIFNEVEDVRDSLRLNPKLIQICTTREEAQQVCYDLDPR